MFILNRKILKRWVIIKRICIKEIFYNCINLNLDYYQQFETIYITNNKNNPIKINLKDDLKAKIK